MSGDGSNRKVTERAARPEVILGGLGILAVVGLIGLLAFEAVTESNALADLKVEVRRIIESQPGYAVELVVENSGGETAAAVAITGTLVENGRTVEEASATITYVPSDSRREAVLLFDHDPRNYTLEVSPTGYERP